MLDLSKYQRHTPGPWKAERDICHFDTLSNVVSCEKELRPKLFVGVGGEAGWQEQEANTILIADAPQLLAELREARAENERLAGEVEGLKRLCENKDAYISELLLLTRKDA